MDTLCIDFDRTLHRYSKGWHDGSCYDRPVKGAKTAVKRLVKKYSVVVLTARKSNTHYKVRAWLKKWGFPKVKVTNIKPNAVAYIDDKAVTFRDWKRIKI